MASDYGNLGILYSSRGDLDKAEKMYLKSLEINKDLGRKEGMANNYANLGILYTTLGVWLRLDFSTLPGDATLGAGVVLLGYTVARYNALIQARAIATILGRLWNLFRLLCKSALCPSLSTPLDATSKGIVHLC